MRIALVQMSIVEGEVEKNIETAWSWLNKAPAANVYLLPELWTSGYAIDSWPTIADNSTPAVLDKLKTWSQERNAVVGGTLITRTDSGGLANRFWMIFPSGRSAWYDKGHLFAPLGESGALKAGNRRVRTSVGEWNVALSVCFDLRFPEQYRLDAIEGADAFFVSSAWPEPRCAIVHTLTRARAIENQSVLAMCNRTGPGRPGEHYCGGSVVVGPDGRVVEEAGSEEGVVIAEVNHSDVAASRKAIPVLPLRVAGLDW